MCIKGLRLVTVQLPEKSSPIGSGLNRTLELAPLFAAHGHVDARPQPPVDELAVGGQPPAPLGGVVPRQIVDFARKPLLGFERGVGVGPEEVEGQCVATSLAAFGDGDRPRARLLHLPWGLRSRL
jgi:hypothetical protein